jgi:dihydrodipicolinate synthase/N-acetylneuraminate lyase
MKLRGIVPPIATPLTPDEQVDQVALRKVVNYLIEAGVNGVFVNGTMGAFALLTDSEQHRAVEIVVEEVNGRVPVIAGISDTGTKRVIEKGKEFEKIGADYLAAVPPFYYVLSQESGMRFYREVAQAMQTPLFLYNNPYLAHFDLSIDSIVALAEEPNIVGIKETNQDCNKWVQIFAAFREREDFNILVGTELLIPIAFQLGADCIVGGAHNFSAPIAVELYRAFQANDYSRSVELSEKLAKLCRIFEHGEIWGAFEVALQRLDLANKVTASPYRAPTDSERDKVTTILDNCGLAAVVAH